MACSTSTPRRTPRRSWPAATTGSTTRRTGSRRFGSIRTRDDAVDCSATRTCSAGTRHAMRPSTKTAPSRSRSRTYSGQPDHEIPGTRVRTRWSRRRCRSTSSQHRHRVGDPRRRSVLAAAKPQARTHRWRCRGRVPLRAGERTPPSAPSTTRWGSLTVSLSLPHHRCSFLETSGRLSAAQRNKPIKLPARGTTSWQLRLTAGALHLEDATWSNPQAVDNGRHARGRWSQSRWPAVLQIVRSAWDSAQARRSGSTSGDVRVVPRAQAVERRWDRDAEHGR